jgi:hypothetical protein
MSDIFSESYFFRQSVDVDVLSRLHVLLEFTDSSTVSARYFMGYDAEKSK